MQVLLIIRVRVNYAGLIWSLFVIKHLYLIDITYGRLVIMNEHQKDMCSKYVTYSRVNSQKGSIVNTIGRTYVIN